MRDTEPRESERAVPRTCVSCKTVRLKEELVRVAIKAGRVFVDSIGSQGGRGAYICRSAACITDAFKRGALERALKAGIPSSLKDDLRGELEMILPARGGNHA